MKSELPMTWQRTGLFILWLFGATAFAGDVTIHVGPPSIGTGGTNPVSVPPLSPLEYEVTYVTDSGFESNIAITPGLLFGKRSTFPSGYYVSFGGGLAFSANGSGPGIYSSFGLNYGKSIMFNAEFKQALAYDFKENIVLSPYAVRLGVTFSL